MGTLVEFIFWGFQDFLLYLAKYFWSISNSVNLIAQQSFAKRLGQFGSVFVYELSGCRIQSSCSHLNFIFRVWFEQGIPWHLGNYRVWIHFETHTWHDKNIQSVSKTVYFFLLVLLKYKEIITVKTVILLFVYFSFCGA